MTGRGSGKKASASSARDQCAEEEEEVKAGQKLSKRKAEEGQDHSLKAAEVVELELGR
ncbi:hypothetical protein B484DRAFT_408914 [Ochromonadaceae sp. CCMP2298]|nr:hypothetical protein B484DRAFT_408914 [Ochromonadaceae sp. CCMP2298]